MLRGASRPRPHRQGHRGPLGERSKLAPGQAGEAAGAAGEGTSVLEEKPREGHREE